MAAGTIDLDAIASQARSELASASDEATLEAWRVTHLGFDLATEVRAGKYLEIKVSSTERAAAETTVEEMCQKLLANPVIESYRYEVEEIFL